MQIRTLGRVAVFCFGAAVPFMAAGQAHAAQSTEVATTAATTSVAAARMDGGGGALDEAGAIVINTGVLAAEIGNVLAGYIR